MMHVCAVAENGALLWASALAPERTAQALCEGLNAALEEQGAPAFCFFMACGPGQAQRLRRLGERMGLESSAGPLRERLTAVLRAAGVEICAGVPGEQIRPAAGRLPGSAG